MTTLASFNGTNGANPFGGLILSGSTLYGTTYLAGAYGGGTVFSIPVGGGSVTTLATFNGANGQSPYAGLLLSGSTLYGTTEYSGAYGQGEVFALMLPVNPGGQISQFAINEGAANMTFVGISNYTYHIQVSTNLASWNTMGPANAPANGVVQFKDSNPPQPNAFYRLMWNGN